MKVLCAALSCVLVSGPLYAQSLCLWPSDASEPRKHPASECALDGQRAIQVTTGTGYEWPGITLAFRSGPIDLAEYGTLQVKVSNTCDRTLNIGLSVKNKGQKGSSPGGSLTLAPRAQGILTAHLRMTPWVLDKPLELVGMRGFPTAFGDGTFDVRKTAEIHVFLTQPERPASFAVLSADARKEPLAMLASDTFLPFVDPFGQFAHADWPGKVHAEADLALSKTAEAVWLTNAPALPDRDRWGGWSAGLRLRATGHFRTEKVDGKWWLVDPDGSLFFSHGVDCVHMYGDTGIQYRERYFAWLPDQDPAFAAFYGKASWAPHGFYQDKGTFRTFDFARANLLRKYGPDWKSVSDDLTHRRIRAWGLNTIGNWSDTSVYLMRRTPYTATLHTSGPRIEGSSGWWGKFPDPFSQAFADSIRRQASTHQTSGTTTDPWCIGYFVDNELSWGKDDRDLARASLTSPATQPAKLAFRAWLEKKYATPDALNTAWGTAHPSWEAFLASTSIPDEKKCGDDLTAFHAQIAETYFRTIRDTLKTAAPDKLYLGCRIAWGAPSVYRAASKYCDVVSVNTYSHTVDKDLPDGSEDKPMINGEFHFGALDRGLFHTGLVATESQADRAACYSAFLSSCLSHPRYVGTHWFQWRDQPLTGRGDGENYQIGFLTVTDQPYPELVEAARTVSATMYEKRYGK